MLWRKRIAVFAFALLLAFGAAPSARAAQTVFGLPVPGAKLIAARAADDDRYRIFLPEAQEIAARCGESEALLLGAWYDGNERMLGCVKHSVRLSDLSPFLLSRPDGVPPEACCRVFLLSAKRLLPLCASGTDEPVTAQALSFTESPVDVPNPDRGFYRACDELIVPVSGAPDWELPTSRIEVCGVPIQTRLTHLTFDLRAFSDNGITALSEPYDEDYRAGANVSIRSRGDAAPWDYETHFDYWAENVIPQCPRGVSRPLTEDALQAVRSALDAIRAGEGTAIVRFCYDCLGYSYVSCEHPQDGEIDRLVCCVEPDKDTVLTHISQLKPILHEYEDVIACVDGGFFGPWGEMHSTAFAQSPAAYVWLLDALLDAVPDSRSIAVHGGAFLSWYNAHHGTSCGYADLGSLPAPKPGTPEARFGIFNDSYAYGCDEPDGEPDDWGSLSEGINWPGAPFGTDFTRAGVMAWLRRQNGIYGGEAQGGKTLWNSYPFVAWEAAYAQTVYLNADYSEEVHRRWAGFTYAKKAMSAAMKNAYAGKYAVYDPVYSGKNGLEYFRDRLGYRLVLRSAGLSDRVGKDGTLVFLGKVQNVGFGCVVNRKSAAVLLKNKANGSVLSCPLALDSTSWLPDQDSRASNTGAYRELSFAVRLSDFGSVPPGEYDVYLKLRDPKETSENRRCIRFANEGLWDAALGANRIGSVTIAS